MGSNWRKEGAHRYESLWCLLQKFIFLNRLRPASFSRALIARHPEARLNVPEVHVPIPGLHRNGLLSELHMTERTLAESLPLHYMPPFGQAGDNHLYSQPLRYCAQCLSEGYHSALYQCRCIVQCPIHEEPLRQECPRCSQVLAYRFDAKTFSHPFSCPACKHVLWTRYPEFEWQLSDETDEGLRRVGEARHVLRNLRRQFDAASRHFTVEMRIEHMDVFVAERLRQLQETLGARNVLSCFENESRCRHILWRYTPRSTATVADDIGYAELGRALKALRRYIHRRVMRWHRKCLSIQEGLLHSCPKGELTLPCRWVAAYNLWCGVWYGCMKELWPSSLHARKLDRLRKMEGVATCVGVTAMTEKLPATQEASLRLWLTVAYNSYLWLLSQSDIQEVAYAENPSLPLRLSELIPEFIAWQAMTSRKECLLWLAVETNRVSTRSSWQGQSAEHRVQVEKTANSEQRRLEAVRMRYHTLLNGIRSSVV